MKKETFVSEEEVVGFTKGNKYEITDEVIPNCNDANSGRTILYRVKDDEGRIRLVNSMFFCLEEVENTKLSSLFVEESMPDIRAGQLQSPPEVYPNCYSRGSKIMADVPRKTLVDSELGLSELLSLSGLKEKPANDYFSVLKEGLREVNQKASDLQMLTKKMLNALAGIEEIKDIKAICEALEFVSTQKE